MAIFGRSALLLAFVAAAVGICLALGAHSRRSRSWQASAERAVYATFAFTTLAVGTLWAGLLGDHFELRNVADYSNRALPTRFKFSALWGSQAGSLLLWCWILSIFAALAVWLNRRRNRELMPIVVAILMGVAIFFTGVLSFVTSPFETLASTPADGTGLNPLLQNPYMVIHPPLLYLGYVGLSVPFAFAMAALVTRRVDTQWIVAVRRWTILSWLFLGSGILLGSRWAYEELGWGGYWAWDPVENAALMPWLVATAFLHSVMVQERRGMLKVWNMSLVTLTFSLSLFGTFLTRSGLLSSIHAFGQSTLGPYFLGLIIVVAGGAIGLIISRLSSLRSEHGLESFVSREGIFLFNNLLLVGLAAIVFFGTMYPVFTEATVNRKIAVGPSYFEQLAVPIGVALLILTGVGPLVAWRKASLAQLRRRFVAPLVVAVVGGALLILTPAWDHWVAGLVFTAGIFVVACVTGEFIRGTQTRHRLGGVSWPGAFIQLVSRNRRRFGGYIVHLGVVLVFVALAGSKSFAKETDLALLPGESADAIGYTFVNECLPAGVTPPAGQPNPCPRVSNANERSVVLRLGVFKDGKRVVTLTPGRRIYVVSQQPSTEVGLSSTPARDYYAVLNEMIPGKAAKLSVFINPLVMWLWLSGLLIVFGGLVAAWPTRRATRLARAAEPSGTQVA